MNMLLPYSDVISCVVTLLRMRDSTDELIVPYLAVSVYHRC